MAEYDDYQRDQDWFFRELDELDRLRNAENFEHRVMKLIERSGRSRRELMQARTRLVKNAVKLFGWTEEEAQKWWADKVLDLDPSH